MLGMKMAGSGVADNPGSRVDQWWPMKTHAVVESCSQDTVDTVAKDLPVHSVKCMQCIKFRQSCLFMLQMKKRTWYRFCEATSMKNLTFLEYQ